MTLTITLHLKETFPWFFWRCFWSLCTWGFAYVMKTGDNKLLESEVAITTLSKLLSWPGLGNSLSSKKAAWLRRIIPPVLLTDICGNERAADVTSLSFEKLTFRPLTEELTTQVAPVNEDERNNWVASTNEERLQTTGSECVINGTESVISSISCKILKEQTLYNLNVD